MRAVSDLGKITNAWRVRRKIYWNYHHHIPEVVMLCATKSTPLPYIITSICDERRALYEARRDYYLGEQAGCRFQYDVELSRS